MKKFIKGIGLLLVFVALSHKFVLAQKKLYIANDDHTDFFLTRDSSAYATGFVHMLDRWMQLNDDSKAANPGNPNLHVKWTCDGSYWVSIYEKVKGPGAQFDRLIQKMKDGQVTVPYSPLVISYGGVPIEGVLRGMYYSGKLERRFPGLKLKMATAMENQTLPLGLASLWKGSGAKYAWHGVCNCSSDMDQASFGGRQKEMYWYKGLDTNRILMKWYKMKDAVPFGNRELGGYAEVFSDSTGSLPSNTNISIDDLAAKCNTTEYPFNIAAAFGVGHDAFITTKDELVAAAAAKTNATQTVIVSNEVDFFEDFESTYEPQNKIDPLTQTYGNDWDLNCASIAEVSAKVKRAIEKLRTAEAMAAIERNFDLNFLAPLQGLKEQAWEAIGLYWEHSMGFDDGGIPSILDPRNAFQRRLEATITAYADALYNVSKKSLAQRITKGFATNTRFFAFNPLGWIRSDYADFRFNDPGASAPFKVVEIPSNSEVPYQFITKNGDSYLRILASNIPSVGYKTFEIQAGAPFNFGNVGTTTTNTVENDFFTITYTNQGVLTNILDKTSGKQLVAATNGRYVNDLGSGLGNNGATPTVQNGPVNVTVTTSSNSFPTHTTKITLYKDVPRIEIDNKITQNFFNTTYSWAYSFNNTPTSEIWHEEVGAVIKAKLTNNGGHYATQNARYDWNTLNHFASINETPNGAGVSVSNQDCYFMKIGNSTLTTLDQNSTQLNIMVGGKNGPSGSIGFIDQGGDNEFNQRFAITTHTAYDAASEMKKALEHQNSLVCDTVLSTVNFLLPDQFSYIKVNDPGTVLWSVKPAEEEGTGGTIIRAWNLINNDAAPNLDFDVLGPIEFNSAFETTHLETDISAFGGIAPRSKTLQVPLGANQMKTVRILTTAFALSLNSSKLDFTGYRGFNSTTNQLTWTNNDETQIKTYTLERSSDGNSFSPITSIIKNNGKYTYNDNLVNPSNNHYYRLKIIKNDGRIQYSNIVFIRADAQALNLLIYPNPTVDVLNASLVINKQQRCLVTIVNTAGAIVASKSPLFERGSNTYSILTRGLPAGAYNLVIATADKTFVQPFVKK
jgi:alpha-mannosidase